MYKEKKVLIVEDSRAMVELLTDIFNEVDYRIVGTVDNGQDAIALYMKLLEEKNRPDVVIMDIVINGLDGIDATRKIKEYDPHSNIIVLTSTLDHKVKRKMRSLDVYDYLIKPVSKHQLINSIEQSIAKNRGVIY